MSLVHTDRESYTPGEVRGATSNVAQALYDHAAYFQSGIELPTVRQHLLTFYGEKQFPPDVDRAERYALGGALANLIMREVFTGDGEAAQLIRYTQEDYEAMDPPEAPPEDPFQRFWDSTIRTLVVAENTLDTSAYGAAARYYAKRYDWAMGSDPSTVNTRLPVEARSLAGRSEGPEYAALYIQAFGFGLSRQPKVADSAQIVRQAHEAVVLLRQHASQHVLPFRGIVAHDRGRNIEGKLVSLPLEPYQKIIDISKARLKTSSSGKCRLDLGDELIPNELWTQRHPPNTMTLRCPLSLVKLESGDAHPTLVNFLHAMINRAIVETPDQYGLFSPELAKHYWQQRAANVHYRNQQANYIN